MEEGTEKEGYIITQGDGTLEGMGTITPIIYIEYERHKI